MNKHAFSRISCIIELRTNVRTKVLIKCKHFISMRRSDRVSALRTLTNAQLRQWTNAEWQVWWCAQSTLRPCQPENKKSGNDLRTFNTKIVLVFGLKFNYGPSAISHMRWKCNLSLLVYDFIVGVMIACNVHKQYIRCVTEIS